MRLGIAPLDPRWLGDTAGGRAAILCRMQPAYVAERRSRIGLAWNGGAREGESWLGGLA